MTQISGGNMQIMAAQDEIQAMGYQWQETVYNDIYPENCSIIFTKDKSPVYFSNNCLGDTGWGRFPRSVCWQKALIGLRKKEE